MASPGPAPQPKKRRRRDDTTAPVVLHREGVPAELRRYVGDLVRWRAGNQVTLLRAGRETFPAMLEAIAGARRSVCLETYIFESDGTGRRFAAALIERARAGIAVRVLYDAIGSFNLAASLIDEMREAGVRVVEYHPLAPWRRRWGVSRRDHRKILVVDDEVAFTGGVNVTDENAAVEDGGKGWHDLHCRVRGPVVSDLSRLFRRVWLLAGGDLYRAPPRASKVPPTAGDVPVHMLDNRLTRRRRIIRRAYLHAINAAREAVLLENAYFLPDRGVRRALARAVRRGVDVRVIVPNRSDVRTIQYAGMYVYRRMVKAGIKILRWRGLMNHAKVGVVDGVWSIIGSYNLDARSLFYNLEVAVEALDRTFGAIMVEQFRTDEANADVFDERAWTALPWWRKALAWLAFQARGWL
jgi:cardiolipin synthase A/B